MNGNGLPSSVIIWPKLELLTSILEMNCQQGGPYGRNQIAVGKLVRPVIPQVLVPAYGIQD